ncbi:MAG: cytochrome c family protein [Alphaproteobacteria bacterium]|nr:cytochrome c family protein [Alphaproteobacteria bacterium]
MSTFELNKIIGACLTAGLIGMLTFMVPKLIFEGHEGGTHGESATHAKASAEPEGEAAGVKDEAADTAAYAAPISAGAALAKGDPENGAKVFKKCAACHTIEKDGKAKVGPNLWGITSAKVAHMDGFAYSDAMKAKGGQWSLEALYAFIENPKAYVPGTKMGFAGLKKASDRADVLAYMNFQSESPAPLPPAE